MTELAAFGDLLGVCQRLKESGIALRPDEMLNCAGPSCKNVHGPPALPDVCGEAESERPVCARARAHARSERDGAI